MKSLLYPAEDLPSPPHDLLPGCLLDLCVCTCRWLCHPAERWDEHPAGSLLQPAVCLVLLHRPGPGHPAWKQLRPQCHLCHRRRDVPLHWPGWHGASLSLCCTLWLWLMLKHRGPTLKSVLLEFVVDTFYCNNQTPQLLSPQFPEMDAIAQGERRVSSKVIFFIIQNAGLLSGFTIILMITMFAGQINLGWMKRPDAPPSLSLFQPSMKGVFYTLQRQCLFLKNQLMYELSDNKLFFQSFRCVRCLNVTLPQMPMCGLRGHCFVGKQTAAWL